jgi:hypothetical protein
MRSVTPSIDGMSGEGQGEGEPTISIVGLKSSSSVPSISQVSSSTDSFGWTTGTVALASSK